MVCGGTVSASARRSCVAPQLWLANRLVSSRFSINPCLPDECMHCQGHVGAHHRGYVRSTHGGQQHGVRVALHDV